MRPEREDRYLSRPGRTVATFDSALCYVRRPVMVRVLFVDDEEHMLRAIERLMRGHGLEVYLEREPLRALDVVADRHIEILVADHMMPGMTGVKLLAAARRKHPRIIRVLMTGSADREVAIDAVNEGGIEHFIEKPWPPGELQRVLVELSMKVLQERMNSEASPNAALAIKSFKK
jgi:adenylate cyclase